MLSILKCFFWKKKQLLKIPTFQEIIRLQELQFKQPTLLTPFYAKEFIEFGVYGQKKRKLVEELECEEFELFEFYKKAFSKQISFLRETDLFKYYLMAQLLQKLTYLYSFESLLEIDQVDITYFFNYYNYKDNLETHSKLEQEDIKINISLIEKKILSNCERFTKMKEELFDKARKISKNRIGKQ